MKYTDVGYETITDNVKRAHPVNVIPRGAPVYNVADTIALLNSRFGVAEREMFTARRSIPEDDAEYRGSNEMLWRGGGVDCASHIKGILQRASDALASAMAVL